MTLRRAISGATAAVLVLLSAVTTGGVAAAVEPATATITAVVDPETYHEYPGTDEAETYFATTGHAGRVWTDKTVFKEKISVSTEDGADDTILEDDQFGVALSALGSTRHLTSQVPTPIDVVLVLDLSTSMTYCIEQPRGSSTTACTAETGTSAYTESRAAAMVEAVNTALGIIEEDSDKNRVALSWFSELTGVLANLGAPQKIQGDNDYVKLVRGDNGRLYIKHANGQQLIGTYTNTQLGFATGMNILANQKPELVTGKNQRLANVVFLTDGEPTRSSSASAWWAPTGSELGNHNQPSYGNGFKAAMTAAYLKNKIADVYGDPLNPVQVEPRVYTIGMGIEGLSDDGYDLSMATLNPRENLWATGNRFYEGFNSAFAEYRGGTDTPPSSPPGTPTVPVTNTSSHKVEHPKDDPYEVTDLRYNDAFYSPVGKAQLIEAFTKIANQIIAPVANPPVQTTVGAEATGGYVTFTDPLGEFMEVSAIDRLTFCSLDEGISDPADCEPAAFFAPEKKDPIRTESGSIDTYTFVKDAKGETAVYKANDIYPETEVSEILIEVERFDDPATGDTVTVKIPSALLPMRDSYITLDKDGEPVEMSVEVSHPVHVFYVVSPKEVTPKTDDVPKTTVIDYLDDPIALNEAKPGWGAALTRYVRDNVEDGKVRFYANAFGTNATTGTPEAQANATFLPATGNLFYRFGTDTVLYLEVTDGDGPLKVNPESTVTAGDWDGLPGDTPVYYIYESYRQQPGNDAQPVVLDEVVLETTKEMLTREGMRPLIRDFGAGEGGSEGVMAVQAYTRNYARAANMDHLKCTLVNWDDNGVPTCGTTTDTETPDAELANTTETDPMVRATTYEDQIVTVRLGNNGYLETPTPGIITVAKVVESAPSLNPSAETSFAFKLEVTVDEDGPVLPEAFPVEVFEDTSQVPADGFYVSNGETFELKANQVARIYGLPHGSTYTVTEAEMSGYTSSDNGKTTGEVVVGGEVPEIVFTNTYQPSPVAVDGPSVEKVLTGGEWRGYEIFEALLWSSESDQPIDRVELTATNRIASFNEITFNKPGTYTYTITELDGYKTYPAVSFSPASYQWIVTVSDDGSGTLTATTSMTRTIPDPGVPETGPVESKVATFTNRFDADNVYGALQAVKVVDDLTLADSESRSPELSHTFEFWYAGVDLVDGDAAEDAPDLVDVSLPHFGAEDVVRATNAPKSSDIASPELTFGRAHVGHVYYYGVTEVENDSLEFVKYDPSVFFYRIAVVAGDDGVEVKVTHCQTTKGAVSEGGPLGTCADSFATDPGADAPVIFTNTYDAGPASVDLEVTKVLQGRPWSSDAFEFVLEPNDEDTIQAVEDEVITMPTSATATAAGDRNATFRGITFTQQGEYQFRVREVLPDGVVNGVHNGIAYDTHDAVYDVVVTNPGVTGDASDQLVAQVTLNGREDEDRSTFTNVYSASPVTATPVFVKTLIGRDDWLPTDEFRFTFALAAVTDGAPLPSTTSVTVGSADEAEGFTFGSIRFMEPGTYRYSVTEQAGQAQGIRYDESTVTFAVVVEVDGRGELVANIAYDNNDHEFVNEFVPTTWTLNKSSDQDPVVAPGDEITYTITATNTSKDGAAPLTKVVITDDLSDVLGTDDNRKAHWVGFVGDHGEAAKIDGSTLTWKLDELTGSETLSYTVRIDDAAHDVTLRNAVTGMGGVDPDGDGGGDVPPESCVAGTPVANLDDECVTVHVTGPGWTIAKSSPTASTVKPGDTIEYVVDVTFLGHEGSVIPGVVVVDDLSDVLEHATPDLESIVPSVGKAELADGVLRWTIGDLTGNARLTYAVTVNDDAHGVDLVNVVTGSGGTDEDEDGEGETPPVACATGEDPECTTVHTTDPGWTIAKSSPTASEVKPGDTIEYVLDVTLLGDEGRSIPSVVVIDDLSDVLEHASFDEASIVASVGEATLVDDMLSWDIGDLTENATLRYTVTVSEDAIGVSLRNVVTGMGNVDEDGEGDLPPATCAAGTDSDDLAEECTTVHTTDPTWTLSKSSDDPDGKAVPGQIITYTLTATVSGADRVTVPNVDIVDDLSGLLDHANLVEGSLKASQGQAEPGDDGSSLVWHLDELTGEATLTYQVVVGDNAYGVDLVNVVTGSGGPDGDGDGEGDNPPTACAADSEDLADQCTTVHVTDPTWNLAKSSDDPDGKAEPGQVITYTLTATPVGENVDALTDLVITDDLSDVVGDGKATFETILDGEADAKVSDDGTTLVWRIDRLTETATLRYSVKVDVEAYGVTLRNVVTGTSGDGTYPPATCAAPELMAPAVVLDAAPMALSVQTVEEFIDEECSTTHATDPEPVPDPTEPEPDPDPTDPTEPPEDPSTGSGQPPSDPADPIDVSTGGALARSGATLAALAAAAGLMTMAGLLLVHRRRKESTE